MPTKAIQTSLRGALPADRQGATKVDLVAEAAEDSARVPERCILLFVRSAVKTPKYLSFHGAIGPYTAATATASSAPAAVAVPTNTSI